MAEDSSSTAVKAGSELRFQVRKRRSSAEEPLSHDEVTLKSAAVPPAAKKPVPPPISAFIPPSHNEAASAGLMSPTSRSRPSREDDRVEIKLPPVQPIEPIKEPPVLRAEEGPHRPRRPLQSSLPPQTHHSSGENAAPGDLEPNVRISRRSLDSNRPHRRSFDEAEQENEPQDQPRRGSYDPRRDLDDDDPRQRRRSIEDDSKIPPRRRNSNDADAIPSRSRAGSQEAFKPISDEVKMQSTIINHPSSLQAKPVSVALKQEPMDSKAKKDPITCWDKTVHCYETSPFCPSRTRALELFSLLLDAAAVGFYVLAMSLPWVKSVAPCTSCPEGFVAGTWLAQNGIQASFGLFTAGSLTNSAFLPVSDYFTVAKTNQTLRWAEEYAQYYFPPASSLLWTEMNSNNVCAGGSPAFVTWGFPYGMCPYSAPSAAIGSQALMIIACCFAGLSFMSMIAARKGRVGFAQFSAFCSSMSFCFGLGAVLWFSLWSYIRQHIDIGRGTVPIKVVSRAAEVTTIAIIPVAANYVFDSGYFFAIFALIFEIITTIISWVAGTEKCWWTPDDDVVFGPDSWVLADFEYPNRVRRPSLMEMSQRQHVREQMATEQYEREMAMV